MPTLAIFVVPSCHRALAGRASEGQIFGLNYLPPLGPSGMFWGPPKHLI